MTDVFSDLTREGDELRGVLADLSPEDWERPTPSPGWTVADQVAHLTFVNSLALMAARRDPSFDQARKLAGGDFQGTVDRMLAEYRKQPDLLGAWQREHEAAVAALAAAPRDEMVPWLVNELPPSVLGAAGLLELFAHGQDIRDALGIRREYDDRIGHLAFFGSRTRDFGYLARDEQPPAEEFRFELTAPSGAVWAFGPEDAEQRVCGPAADFALLVSRRRNRADLALVAEGADADHWMDIAQAYRGPSGPGREPGQHLHPQPQPTGQSR